MLWTSVNAEPQGAGTATNTLRDKRPLAVPRPAKAPAIQSCRGCYSPQDPVDQAAINGLRAFIIMRPNASQDRCDFATLYPAGRDLSRECGAGPRNLCMPPIPEKRFVPGTGGCGPATGPANSLGCESRRTGETEIPGGSHCCSAAAVRF
jgi:hypothetical protein